MKKQSCVYPNVDLMPNQWNGEENDGLSQTDQNPSMSLKEMVENYVATGQFPPSYNEGDYDDPEESDDDLIPAPVNVDLSDVHNAGEVIQQAENLIAESDKRKKKKAEKIEKVDEKQPVEGEPSEPGTV